MADHASTSNCLPVASWNRSKVSLETFKAEWYVFHRTFGNSVVCLQESQNLAMNILEEAEGMALPEGSLISSNGDGQSSVWVSTALDQGITWLCDVDAAASDMVSTAAFTSAAAFQQLGVLIAYFPMIVHQTVKLIEPCMSAEGSFLILLMWLVANV